MNTDALPLCPVCPNRCHLAAGQIGPCRSRASDGNSVHWLARDRVCALCVDPMEKKPLFHFFPGTPVLSLGMAGCNLHCKNCQNAHISQHGPDEVPGQPLPPDALPRLLAQEGARAVAYTYTEPLVALEYVRDCARVVRAAGGRNVLVTAAYVRLSALETLLPFIDAANVDIKAMSETFYRANCRAALVPVLAAARRMRAAGVHLEITNLVIPDANDTDDAFLALSRFVRDELGAETPLHFSRFFPCHELRALPPTPEATLRRARAIALGEGLAHVYLGNTRGAETTFCAACHAPLITRDGYHITRNALRPGGLCPACGAPLHGRF